MEKSKEKSRMKNVRPIRDYGTAAVEIKINFQMGFALFMEIENLKNDEMPNDWLLAKFADMLGEQFGFCEPTDLQNYFAPETPNED